MRVPSLVASLLAGLSLVAGCRDQAPPPLGTGTYQLTEIDGVAKPIVGWTLPSGLHLLSATVVLGQDHRFTRSEVRDDGPPIAVRGEWLTVGPIQQDQVSLQLSPETVAVLWSATFQLSSGVFMLDRQGSIERYERK